MSLPELDLKSISAISGLLSKCLLKVSHCKPWAVFEHVERLQTFDFVVDPHECVLLRAWRFNISADVCWLHRPGVIDFPFYIKEYCSCELNVTKIIIHYIF